MWSVSKLFGAERVEPKAAEATATAGPLTATSYDEQYYREHADAGLDYLNHGFWHRSYAAMVSEATLQGAYSNPFVVDAGCACGSILKGFKDLSIYHRVLGVDLSDHMVALGRRHFKFAAGELIGGSIAEIPAEFGKRYTSAFRSSP